MCSCTCNSSHSACCVSGLAVLGIMQPVQTVPGTGTCQCIRVYHLSFARICCVYAQMVYYRVFIMMLSYLLYTVYIVVGGVELE